LAWALSTIILLRPVNFPPILALPAKAASWSITTLADGLVKIGAEIIRHGQFESPRLPPLWSGWKGSHRRLGGIWLRNSLKGGGLTVSAAIQTVHRENPGVTPAYALDYKASEGMLDVRF
jgi:hypothetical protein